MMRTTFPILRYSRSRGAPTDDLCQVTDRLYLPPLRNLPELGIHQAVGEEVGEVGREAWVAALHLRADGVETHEPRLEERPRHLLQRLAHPAVHLDLVVERAEDVGDGALFVDIRRKPNGRLVKMVSVDSWNGRLVRICKKVYTTEEIADK